MTMLIQPPAGADDADDTGDADAADDSAVPGARRRRRLGVLAVPPVLFTVLFAVRAVRPVVDTTLLLVLVAMLVVLGGLLRRKVWAGVAFLAFPVALLASPAAADLSFSLVADDSDWWRWHAVLALISAGASLVTAAVVALGARTDGWRLPVMVGAGLVAGVGMLAVLQVVSPTEVYGTDLTAAERAELPRIALVNFAYAPLDLQLEPGEVYRAVLVNPSDLPHTLSIDEIGLDLRVPAGREAVVEIDAAGLPDGTTEFYCSVGDHRAQGMVGQVEVG